MKNTGFSTASMAFEKQKAGISADHSNLRSRINKIVKENKIPIPMTRAGFKQLSKALNIHCSEITSFEAIIHCRGPKMDDSPPESFDMDKLVEFIDYKSRILPPADNPRQSMQSNRNYYTAQLNTSQDAYGTKLPALKGATNGYL